MPGLFLRRTERRDQLGNNHFGGRVTCQFLPNESSDRVELKHRTLRNLQLSRSSWTGYDARCTGDPHNSRTLALQRIRVDFALDIPAARINHQGWVGGDPVETSLGRI